MKEILAYKKTTENKYRWDAIVDDTQFEFYIPKWRIPFPVTEKILINIYTDKKNVKFLKTFTPEKIGSNEHLKKEPIFSELEYKNEHTKTYRYDPIGNNKNWEIGNPYIPKSFFENKIIDHVYINVEWK